MRSTQSSKATPIPAWQRAEKAIERDRVQQEIDAAIDEWFKLHAHRQIEHLGEHTGRPIQQEATLLSQHLLSWRRCTPGPLRAAIA